MWGWKFAKDSGPSPTPERIPRVARVLALAHHWQGLIRTGTVRDAAQLSRLVGVSRARVSQVMRLLDLAPEIQALVLDGRLAPSAGGRSLRALADLPLGSDQRRAWDPAHHDASFP